jgi:hypothetical protein
MYDASLGLLFDFFQTRPLAARAPIPAPGSSPVALATFLQLLRPQTLQEQHAQRVFNSEVQQIASRLRRVFDDWAAMREIEPDNARLANTAAVNRWELMRLAKHAEGLAPPRSLINTQRDVHNAVIGAARACQLLANGYRFHKSEAVCDGQALLVETVQDMGELVSQLQMR